MKTFTCSNPIGKWGCTSVVIHILNWSCTNSVSVTVSSNSSKKSNPRWQFCSKAHPPSAMKTDINFRACTPWPCPIDTARQSICIFFAKSSIWFVGSEPIDRKQMRGVRGSLSIHVSFMFKITGFAYISPIEYDMYLRACATVRSGHQDLKANNFRLPIYSCSLGKWELHIILMQH